MVSGENVAGQQAEFREELIQVLGGRKELPDDWECTAGVVSEQPRKCLVYDGETWW